MVWPVDYIAARRRLDGRRLSPNVRSYKARSGSVRLRRLGRRGHSGSRDTVAIPTPESAQEVRTMIYGWRFLSRGKTGWIRLRGLG